MKLTLKLTDDVPKYAHYGQSSETRTETIVDVEEVQFSRSLMGSLLRALANEIDPPRASLGQWTEV